MSDIIDKIIKEFDGVLIDDYGWEHYKVDNKDYDIRFDRSRLEWACDVKHLHIDISSRKNIVNTS